MEKLILFCLILPYIIEGHEIKGFDDSILYSINWPGENTGQIDFNNEFITVKSSHNENYNCYLPDVQQKEINTVENYDGPAALELIAPLFYMELYCSYRIESYWTYEVCHGRYIRQYHEDREGQAVIKQEFTLGKWDKALQEKMVLESVENKKKHTKNGEIPTKKIDGSNLPYLEVVMGNGTLCDLNNNKPRMTSVLYVCHTHGKNEIYSLKETSICQYEIIILTSLLCSHPLYKPIATGENKINCIPADKESPNKPYNLLKMKEESRRLRKNPSLDHIHVEFIPLEKEEKEKDTTPVDTSSVEGFLAGRNCLNGGTGWWKYEFCYGKSVEQYHIEKDGSKSSINLGLFNEEKHLHWIANNPHKRPKPSAQRTQLSHFYSDGSVCDKTGKARQTEVKLKCLDNSNSVNKVSLYLLEPRYCEYILGVESPLICDILMHADENGLVDIDADTFKVAKELSLNIGV